MAETNDQPIEQTEFSWKVDKDFRSIYSNQVLLSSTAFDFAMTFGDIVNVTTRPDGTASAMVEQRTRVIMSPLHFKIFALTCLKNVQNYEDRFGKINPPGGEELARVVEDTANEFRPK